jgi:cytoskeletal protein CcmA (bactofilin family)
MSSSHVLRRVWSAIFNAPSVAPPKRHSPAPEKPVASLLTLEHTPSPTPNTALGSVNSLIAAGVRFDGALDVTGGIKIDGEVAGRVHVADGTLILTGKVEGDVCADVAYINGVVEGNVHVKSALLGPTARVKGSMRYLELHWHQGAVVEGELRLSDASTIAATIANAGRAPKRSDASVAPLMVAR